MACKKHQFAQTCTKTCKKRFYAIPPLVIPPFVCHRFLLPPFLNVPEFCLHGFLKACVEWMRMRQSQRVPFQVLYRHAQQGPSNEVIDRSEELIACTPSLYRRKPHLFKFWRITNRGAQPSQDPPRKCASRTLTEGSQGSLRGSLRGFCGVSAGSLRGLCGALRGSAGFSEGSEPILVTLGKCRTPHRGEIPFWWLVKRRLMPRDSRTSGSIIIFFSSASWVAWWPLVFGSSLRRFIVTRKNTFCCWSFFKERCGTARRCAEPKWPKMVKTTILVKMSLF